MHIINIKLILYAKVKYTNFGQGERFIFKSNEATSKITLN